MQRVRVALPEFSGTASAYINGQFVGSSDSSPFDFSVTMPVAPAGVGQYGGKVIAEMRDGGSSLIPSYVSPAPSVEACPQPCSSFNQVVCSDVDVSITGQSRCEWRMAGSGGPGGIGGICQNNPNYRN